MSISIFWFRRDLRLEDNTALFYALKNNENVLPIFIFDTNIIDELPKNDARISFIYQTLSNINDKLNEYNSSLLVLKGNPTTIWSELLDRHTIKHVYINKDYEPYAIKRDKQIEQLLLQKGIKINQFKDQVIFEENEIVKDNNTPYTVFTPYKNKWLQKADLKEINQTDCTPFFKNLNANNYSFPTHKALGFEKSEIIVKPYNFNDLTHYDKIRDYPFLDKTSYLSPHLRFGTISIRKLYHIALKTNKTFLSELIWREFFMQILFHFPYVVTNNFKPKYDKIPWRNNNIEFEQWCQGKTGYPIVDAGMRQLNKTGYMHNRVRMITASFLCKHLLIDWRWGEAYFAKKLLDYDLSANNGNWQWASGTGCDAAPYFRVFNPSEQTKKFDAGLKYIHVWVEDINELTYPAPIVEHNFARKRAIETYKLALQECL